MSKQKRYRIGMIEPSPIIREGTKVLLEKQPDFTVVETYPDLQAFEEAAKRPVFDVMLINPSIVQFHKQFSVKSVLSNYTQATLVAIVYNYVNVNTLAGFDGTLDIYDEEQLVAKKLRKVIQENEGKDTAATEDNVELSEREKEILIAVAKGMTNKEIANAHFISIHTVISHRKNITQKIGIKTVAGLTLYAVLNNLI